jgi:hypothetical protein
LVHAFVQQVRTLFVSGLPMDAKPRELYLLFRAYKVSVLSQLGAIAAAFEARATGNKKDIKNRTLLPHSHIRIITAIARIGSPVKGVRGFVAESNQQKWQNLFRKCLLLFFSTN